MPALLHIPCSAYIFPKRLRRSAQLVHQKSPIQRKSGFDLTRGLVSHAFARHTLVVVVDALTVSNASLSNYSLQHTPSTAILCHNCEIGHTRVCLCMYIACIHSFPCLINSPPPYIHHTIESRRYGLILKRMTEETVQQQESPQLSHRLRRL